MSKFDKDDAVRDLIGVAGEADTLTQNLIEYLRSMEAEDHYATDLLMQVRALGDNARKALARAKAAGISTWEQDDG